ncbi:hypothetical protein ASPWEDRAFT_175080 [Aspergillus wentii DTO 134E9]|uniref:Pleckstrin homology domain-containing protein n=1 Tax=Aspergillus wentii DTO 134E9 TaxID=1073089 RepID=A0A1L9RA06_ASPWE|nr:uncharacterized protein ASPWEDRAFT_175080 [Aspergillus wentii DTO 134E9]KAI9927362.1 hypothetical protein MW887_002974 [Aspergillus wentii]OJJ31756.1 hypothetical protein ASPWEDRAFT_175080 [Aspergillus wentii DTO 134E9]
MEFQTPSTARAFPAPSTTPYRRPSRARSRPSLHREDSSPTVSSSPTSLPNQNFSPEGPSDLEDPDEDNLMPFDPRRFTPTLHASLVSEILSLRRDVEGKTKAIDVLERSLDDSRIENESLHDSLSQSTKETRSLQHQLKLLEGGSSSALTELAKDRDNALESISDVRKKLEQTQKKVRSREEDAERAQLLLDRERQSWEGERRKLEHKVHVVEGRLKTILNEVAAAQAAGSFRAAPKADGTELAKEGTTAKDSDTASVYSSSPGRRRTSVTSMSTDDGDFHDVRFSVMSVANGQGKNDSLNLAEELAFDEEEEFEQLEGDSTPYSPEALPEERPTSVQSQLSHTIGMGMKARKILGLSLHGSADGNAAEDRVLEMSSPVKSLYDRSCVYEDAGVQYSPPPSPKLPSESQSLRSVNDAEESRSSCQMKDSSTLTLMTDMVSTSCQTVGDLPSPPWTPKIVEPSPPAQPPVEVKMISSSAQTEQAPVAEAREKRTTLSPNDASSSEVEIPMIAIHPPCSEPPSPRGSVMLPPRTKSASCQTNFRAIMDGRSIGIQTEGIRIDQRPVKLPASLLPSAIPDLPLSPKSQEPPPIQPYRAPPLRLSSEDKKTRPFAPERTTVASRDKQLDHIQAYPGNNDNGPLSDDLKSGIRRPMRSSSLFAGFEQVSDEEAPETEKDIFTDDELLNRPFASYKLRRGKLVSAQPGSSLDDSPLPEIDEHLMDNALPLSEDVSTVEESRDTLFGPTRGQRSGAGAAGARQQDIRRAAMITSGAAAHQRIRARSPSEPSIDSGSGSGSSIAPPFPVPIRLSSRNFPVNGSEGRQSPTPSGSRNFSDRGHQPIVRRPTMRRVRSATTMSQTDPYERPSSQRSMAMSTSSFTPDSPRRPLPFDDIVAPRPNRRRSTRGPGSIRAFAHERMDSAATSIQQTSVVDAIAQTMVGEWMFKYIRRRRSFGGNNDSKENWDGKNADEVSANITNSGVRHKRWVWLAPYERAVMWSSKQPTSGPALLGKSGRKFTIQSVLDVKDDNPLPKGFNPQNQFNRSILILTPQRALKFTATSIERHYVWLTALSFLSHSAMGIHDLASLPPVPQEEFASPAPTAALRKNPIRDSIRVAKGKPRPGPKGKRPFANHVAPVPELPSDGDSMLSAADPPTVPRFSNHSRKRSNTAPRMPAIRSFSSIGTMPSSNSGATIGSSDVYAPPMYPQGISSGRSSFSRRTSEASGPSSVGTTGNFFDAIGTVRMEAFIDQTESNRHRVGNRRPRNGSKASSQWSQGYQGHHHALRDLDFPTLEDSSELYFRHDDPFRGF